MTEAPSALRSTSTGHRVDLVDALRGFALFGVVVSNVAVFAGYGTASGPESSLDHRLGILVSYLVTGKFLALFALLFGLSFGLQIQRSADRNEPVIARHLRRLGSLFLIGIAHRVLFGADILMTYAVLGVVLLLLRNVSDRTLVLCAVLGLGLPELWRAVAQWIQYQPPPLPVSRAERIRLATEGPYLELVRMRVTMLTRWWSELMRQGLIYLTPFLIGLWAARRRILESGTGQERLLRTVCWGGLLLAVGGHLGQGGLRPMLAGEPSYWTRLGFGILWNATTFVQAIGYAGGVALLWSRGAVLRRLLSHLVPAGRMALSNYLAVSILVTLVVSATGTYGALGLGQALTFGIVVWLLELMWSTLWLRRHRLGPMEWLWRTATYGRLQPMRILRPKVQPT